ncbi:sulfur carrier protein ThiS [Nocardioides sp. AN3]
MILTVNGAEHALTGADAVADLVEAIVGDRRACGVAVAVNDAVVPHSVWETEALRPGDRVDIVTAVQGG